MKVKYYGTRGSLPVPGPNTIIYGGNTACIKIKFNDTIIILDGGSGLRILGNELMQGDFGKGKGTAHIFFSHAHWDHINGFPFFPPAYVPGNKLIIYGSHKSGTSIRDILSRQQNQINFPVSLEDMAASLEFVGLEAGVDRTCSTAVISSFVLNHPCGAFAYRIDDGFKKVVYATDYEHTDKLDENLVEFTKDADILIYDAMFTPEEYESKKGWGHSTYIEGIKLAKAAKIKQLHLFHYNPEHTDQFIEEIEKQAQQLFPQTYAAKEGWEVEI